MWRPCRHRGPAPPSASALVAHPNPSVPLRLLRISAPCCRSDCGARKPRRRDGTRVGRQKFGSGRLPSRLKAVERGVVAIDEVRCAWRIGDDEFERLVLANISPRNRDAHVWAALLAPNTIGLTHATLVAAGERYPSPECDLPQNHIRACPP